jgi:aspartate/glutamate racemase
MKTIGLLGGMSWESTVTYYQIINEAVKAKLGGLHSAKCVLYSVDFAEIESMQHEGRWEEDFFQGRLARQFNLDTIVPDALERKEVHRIICEELCLGIIRPESRISLHRIMTRLAEQGAEGVILGCTELGLLVGNDDSPVPLFDTTRIHALAAVDFALQPQGGA